MVLIRSLVVAALAASTLAVPATSHADSEARLLVVQNPKATLTDVTGGARLAVTAKVENTTKAKQAASAIVVYLRKPSGTTYDVLTKKVPAVKAGRTVGVSVAGKLPAKVPAGTYTANVCVERKLYRNCEAAPSTVVVAPAELVLGPSSIDFGERAKGVHTVEELTLTNTGMVTAGAPTYAFSGDSGAYFIGTGDCNDKALAPDEFCTITVDFYSNEAFDHDGTMIVKGIPGGTTSTSLTGSITPDPAHLVLTPPSVDFGNVIIGSGPVSTLFTVSNTGDLDATLQGTGVSSTLDGFSLDGLHLECFTANAGVVPAHGSCTLGAQFEPVDTDEAAATFVVTPSAGFGPELESTMTGQGVNAP